MPVLTSSSAVALQLEDVNDMIPLIVEMDSELDSRIKDNGRATRVSTKSFRVRMQVATTGAVQKINLDSGALPSGSASQWDQGTITPLAYAIPVQYSRLADLTGEPKEVASENPVSKTLADAALDIAKKRDMFLQTAGDGKLAQVLSTYAGGGANPITLASTPYGGRLLEKGQLIQVMTNAFALRATATITNVNKDLGATQSITVDAVPAGTVAGDFIVVAGAEQTTPIFINGIPVFHSTSTTGTVLGISRANSYVVANGLSIGSAQISLPVLRTAMNKVVQSLGKKALKNQAWHTHPSQVQAYEELGFQLGTVFSEDGKFKDFDGLFAGKKSIAGFEVIENIHADQTRWDFMNFKSWGKVKWGNPPFWFKNKGGQTVFQQYDSATGNPTPQELSYLVDAIQFYVDNFKVISSVTSCGVPVNN